MLCPFCGSDELRVIDKRNSSDILIRRRRECIKCEKRFTTYERITESELYVLKKSDFREKFDKEKLRKSIMLACNKRPITVEQISLMIVEIEQNLRSSGDVEFKSTYIGKQIVDKLKKIDKIAYIRFASIFNDFKSVDDFKKIVSDLQD